MNLPDTADYTAKISQLLDVRHIILIFIIMTSLGAVHFTALEWDEGSFLQNAEYFSGDKSNFEESRPHLISYLVAGLWALTGESTFSARFLIIIFGVATIYMFHRLAQQEFDDPLPVTAVLAFSPLMLYWSFHVYTDLPALLLALSSLYLYRKKRHFSAGALIALSAVMRYIFLVFAIGMGLAYIFEHQEDLPELISGGLIGSLPFLVYSHIFYGNPFARIQMYIIRVTEWSNSRMFAAVIPGVESGLYMLSTLIPASFTGWSKTSLVEKSMILTYVLFIVFFSGNSYQRYWLALIPFLLLMAYRGLDRRYFFAASAVMLVVSAHGVANNAFIQQECSQSLEKSLDYASNLEGEFVSDSWAVAGYRLDQPVSSLWTDLESLHQNEGVDYAIMSTEESYISLESFSDNCRTYHVYNLSQPSN